VDSAATPQRLNLPPRFYALDALRGLAALTVVVFHWPHFFYLGTQLPAGYRSEDLPLYPALQVLYAHGHLAVDLFFSLSGFVFFCLYAERVAARQIGAQRFAMLRFSRLYPLHLATLLAVVLGQWAHQRLTGSSFVYENNDAWHLALQVPFASSWGLERGLSFNGPVWSVSIEVGLYALFFVVCRIKLHRAWLLALASLIGYFVLWRLHPPIGRGVGSFFLGGVVFAVFQRLAAHPLQRSFAIASAAIATALWVLTLATALGWFTMPAHDVMRSLAWRFPVMVLFPATILALALSEQLRGALGQRLHLLGDISYATYLLHFPLQLVIILGMTAMGIPRALLWSPLSLVAFALLLVGVSLLSYRCFEMPLQRWMRQRWPH
jgi:peptidoglycan/LPS O-acetylase OafA/YrhL